MPLPFSIQDFCRSVATFRARTWKDAMPLVDLLRGVLMHLLNHYTLGAALLKEQAKKDVSSCNGHGLYLAGHVVGNGRTSTKRICVSAPSIVMARGTCVLVSLASYNVCTRVVGSCAKPLHAHTRACRPWPGVRTHDNTKNHSFRRCGKMQL